MGYHSDSDSDNYPYGDNSSNDYDYDYDNDPDDGDEITLGLALNRLNVGPKKKLLVLSLNGLLIHRAYQLDKSKVLKNRNPDYVYNRYKLVYKRPYLEEFLKFVLRDFEVGLWSSSQEHNMDGVLDCISKGIKSELLFIWDQDECTDTGFESLGKKQKPLFVKDLNKLWTHLSNSSRGSRFSASNTLFIDDQPYKALLNPANTGIFPKTYDANDDSDDTLDPKKELGLYLQGVVEAEDVPSYVKEHSFGQPAIAPGHLDWDFYSRVLGNKIIDKLSDTLEFFY